jgi:hypothetical protein
VCKLEKLLNDFLRGDVEKRVVVPSNIYVNVTKYDNDNIENDYAGYRNSDSEEDENEVENDWYDNEHFCN